VEVRAVSKWLRLSPRKARLLAQLIRGKSAEEALAVLANAEKAAAVPVGKTLRSAIANAENDPRNQTTLENLYVKDVRADEGPRRKAIWIRGRGRRDLKVHRMTHITVVVDERETPRVRTAARRRPARAARPARPEPAEETATSAPATEATPRVSEPAAQATTATEEQTEEGTS
jgi:large subunit ribosomal protein L22